MKKTKKTKTPTLHDLAVRLCEGGQVEVQGLVIRAIDVVDGFNPCYWCEMDSLCNVTIADLCFECDVYHNHSHLLKLVTK